MSGPSAIAIARESAAFRLEAGLAESERAGHRNAGILAGIADCHHTLGLVALLADADPVAFGRRLAMAGQADQRCRGLDLAGRRELYMTSRWLPFADALASGDLALAESLARSCPKSCQEGYEYEDDFLRIHVMHRLLLAPDERAEGMALLDRWERVSEGAPGPYHLISQALLARDAGAFDVGMLAALDDRRAKRAIWRKSPHCRIELDATEGSVFVLGLAYLRLAELAQLETRAEFEGMPSLARIPAGSARLAPDSWLSGP